MPRLTLAGAQKKGHLAVLDAMLHELLTWMEKADPNVKPQYAARIQAVSAEIESLRPKDETDVDELVASRKKRRATANAKVRAKQRRRTERRD